LLKSLYQNRGPVSHFNNNNNLLNVVAMVSIMAANNLTSRQVDELTRQDVIRTAGHFEWRRKMTKWTVIVERRELPARPLVLAAAGVPPNDPTNSHQAVGKLKSLGFDTRYAGKSV
jgi:hypothetical protein